MWKDAMWLGLPKSELEKWNVLEGDLTGRFAYYRCEVEAVQGDHLEMDITANSRYRLWINGKPVLSGPCKGDRHRHYYDTVDVSDYLTSGKNIIAVQVLYCNPDTAVSQTDERAAIYGVITPGGGHRLAVEGNIYDSQGERKGTVTTGSAKWTVWLDGSFYLKSDEITIYLGAVCEELDYAQVPAGWKLQGFDDGKWGTPQSLEPVLIDDIMKGVGILKRFQLKERAIPLLYEKEDLFKEELPICNGIGTGILENGKIIVKAGESKEILLDAGVIKNGYPRFHFQAGKGSRICITYFEKFVNKKQKIKTTDYQNGEIIGLTDQVILDGSDIYYEPFWYRTFRFVRICIEAGDVDAVVFEPVFRKTGYPLSAESTVYSSEEWVKEVWDMCVRTLENCMMETYMDCPYYEQLQFVMDTRLQAMFHYSLCTDIQLARKALEDFHCSMTPEGLIHGKYPSAYPQIISTFSLHFIYMLEEYYMQTKDIGIVKKYLPDVDMILGYYDRKIGTRGLVENLGYWEFVDWQEAWKETGGMPAAISEGPSTIINLMYSYALRCGADLNREANRQGMRDEYSDRKRLIEENIERLCWDSEHYMYREGPTFQQYSQHAQAWAILNGMADTKDGKRILRNAIKEETVIKCSFSTAYEWFRAMEKVGLYGETKENMERWIGLKAQGCTTCPEEPENGRSECHAWSALPIYEFIRCMAGIRCAMPGWERVRIEPHMEYLSDLEGQVATPKGTIMFSYKKENAQEAEGENWTYKVTLPDNLDGFFINSDGEEKVLEGGQTYIIRDEMKGV